MKQFLLILFSILTSFFSAQAQNSETISQLTPISPNIGKFSGRLPANHLPFKTKDKLKFEVSVKAVSSDNNKIAFTIKTLDKEVAFQNFDGIPTARLRMYGRITSKNRIIDGSFEEKLSISETVEELSKGINKEIFLHKAFELPEGNYQIGVIITDIVSGNRAIKVIKFKVPLSSDTKQ